MKPRSQKYQTERTTLRASQAEQINADHLIDINLTIMKMVSFVDNQMRDELIFPHISRIYFWTMYFP